MMGAGLGLMAVIWALAVGAQTVYKSVDSEGSVTYSSSPPDEGDVVGSAVIPAQPASSDNEAAARTRGMADELEADRLRREGARATDQTQRSGQSAAETETAPATYQQLSERCEQAREARIAPLRQAEIDRCKSEGRKDPDHCERYYADYGNAFRGFHGKMVPRMFADLPECVAADQARRDQ